MQIALNTSREEVQFSIAWARDNAALFAKSYNEFFREHGDGWVITSNARAGFLTLRADRVAA